MEKITICIPKEMKEYIKKRKVSMSQYCRSALRSYIKYYEYRKKWDSIPERKEAKRKYAKEAWRKKNPPKTLECANPECHIIFTQKKEGRRSLYCNPKHRPSVWKNRRKPFETLECPYCKTVFTQTYRNQKYCSKRCGQKHWYEKRKVKRLNV